MESPELVSNLTMGKTIKIRGIKEIEICLEKSVGVTMDTLEVNHDETFILLTL